MRSNAGLTLEMDLRRTTAHAVVRKLERLPGVRVNILRGRITPERTWLALELAGTPRAVDAALRMSRKFDA